MTSTRPDSPEVSKEGGASPGGGDLRRVVVVGSGFAGYTAARRIGRLLRRQPVEVVLLSDSDGMLYSPLLPDVATGTLDPRAVTVPTLGALPGVRVLRGRATDVDLDGHQVRYTDGNGDRHGLDYTRVLLAPGSVTRLLDVPGLADHAVGLKTVAEALYLRDHLLRQLEVADLSGDSSRRRAALTFLVVGAGYAGTELCAQLARLTRQLLVHHPGVGTDEVHWLLIDVAEAVMPELGPELGDDALVLLRERGVDVRLGTSIKEMTGDQVTLTDGTVLDCSTVVWCAGVTASPVIEALGLPTDHGRLVVGADLRVPDHPDVFGIGDAAAVPDLTQEADDDGHRPICPPTAQHATRQARTAARNIVASLGEGTTVPYRHHDLGLVVDLGGADAAAVPLGLRLRGRAAKAVACGYHLYALPTLRRRARVATDWTLAALTKVDTTSFGLVAKSSALISTAEYGHAEE